MTCLSSISTYNDSFSFQSRSIAHVSCDPDPACPVGKIEGYRVAGNRHVWIKLTSQENENITDKPALFEPLLWAFERNATVQLGSKNCQSGNFGFSEFEVRRD